MRRYQELQQQFLEYRRFVAQTEQEMRDCKQLYEVVAQKGQLEVTLQALSEEVELLSQKNVMLIQQAQKRDFYSDYFKAQQEVPYIVDIT